MNASESVSLAPLPMALRWLMPAPSWKVDEHGLELSAAGATDLFSDPAGGGPLANAPALIGPAPEGDFLFSARVACAQRSTFDAGVLLLYRDERNWAKLCLELSPQGEPTVVSVVTRGVSDDCNSFACERAETFLRSARIDDCFALHASSGDGVWRLVRYFALGGAGEVEIGFLAQSPTGAGCRARFDRIAFARRRLGDLRNGE
jgi:regulation of enolase protein 1 (concanavalin A-like superfamily)